MSNGNSKETIKEKIIEHLLKRNVEFWNEVYIGIAQDPHKRLFEEHNVKEKGGIWIYIKANSSECAREVEKELITLGANGGPGGGSDETIYVYAYKITNETVQ